MSEREPKDINSELMKTRILSGYGLYLQIKEERPFQKSIVFRAVDTTFVDNMTKEALLEGDIESVLEVIKARQELADERLRGLRRIIQKCSSE